MSVEENKAIARRYYDEIMNEANLETIDELMSPDFIFTIPTQPEVYHGPDGFKNLVTMLHGSFPDVHLTVEHLIGEGDTVVGHWTGTGTHTGEPLHTLVGDIPATGKPFRIDGMSWLRIVDGKITESLANEDTLGLLTQIGAIPQEGDPPLTTTPEENKKIVHRYFNELMNEGNMETLEEIFSPNLTFRIPTRPEPIRGHEGMRGFVTQLRSGFPDIKFTIQRGAAEKNMVAIRWTITGTHNGEFLGIPASGNSIEDQGVDIFYIANGQITEMWVNENDMGLMQQMGVFS